MSKDATQRKIESILPGMKQNLIELEGKLAWLDQEREKLRNAVEMQRGAILQSESLLNTQDAPDAPEKSGLKPVEPESNISWREPVVVTPNGV